MTTISSLQGLDALPGDLRWEEFICAIVEAPGGVETLDLTKTEDRQEAALYPRGLAFGKESELRWLERESGQHLVYISDAGKDLGERSLPRSLRVAEVQQPGRLLLWGERQADGAYYDGRIPRLLKYPDWAPQPKPGGRLAVEIRHYELDEQDPPIAMFRCVGIILAEDGHE